MADEKLARYQTALDLFKADLGISHTKRDVYFLSMLYAVDKEFAEKGTILDQSKIEDQMLLCDYALWRYRNRDHDNLSVSNQHWNLPMPKHLELRIMNRKVKARAGNGKR